MAVSIREENGIGIISAEGPITLVTVEAIREKFTQWYEVNTGVQYFVADLSRVDFMDSAGLGLLTSLLKRVSENGGDLKLACLQKKTRMLFEITRAFRVFDTFDSIEEAIRACQE